MSELQIERYTKPGQGSVNSYILSGDGQMALIDTQRTLPEARELLERLKAHARPLQAIVLTHEHPDHIGGLQLIHEHFPDAPIYASQTTIDYIAREKIRLIKLMKGFFGDEFASDIPKPTRALNDGDRVTLAGVEWSVEVLGEGEASSMAMLRSTQENILFCADLVGAHMTGWVGDQHVGAWIKQLDDAQRRFHGVGIVYPGHGDAGRPADMFAPQRTFLEFFRDLVLKEAGAETPSPAAVERIRTRLEAKYPRAAFPGVAGFPFLIDWNAGAMAAELDHRPWSVFTAAVPSAQP